MERLQLSLLVGFGACMGSALRHSIMSKTVGLRRSRNPLHLLVAAFGAFLAGQLTARFTLARLEDPWEILRNGGFLLAGLFGGYVSFPAFTAGETTRVSGVSEAFRLLSSTVVVIVFFCAGALLAM
jgi:fluoride ion exporter CrcB/FEX